MPRTRIRIKSDKQSSVLDLAQQDTVPTADAFLRGLFETQGKTWWPITDNPDIYYTISITLLFKPNFKSVENPEEYGLYPCASVIPVRRFKPIKQTGGPPALSIQLRESDKNASAAIFLLDSQASFDGI